MASRGLVKVALSVTTLDRKLARAMEPRAATPDRRLETLRLLSQAGVPTTIMVAPIIPALNEPEMERILEAGKEAGVKEAGYVLLRPAAGGEGRGSRNSSSGNIPTGRSTS